MSRKTIIYIGGFELPDKNAAAHRVIANGKALRDLGYNVVFIGIDNSGLLKGAMLSKEKCFGFDSYKRPRPRSTREWFSYLINISIYKDVINKYEKVELLIGYNLPSLVLLNLKRITKSKGIRIFSDCTEWYEIKKKGNSLLNYIIRYLDVSFRMKFMNLKLDGVIAISDYLFNYYKTRGVRVVQIPPLVDSMDEKWKKVIHESAEKIQLFYAGTPFSLYNEPSYKDRIDLVINSLYCLKTEGINFQMHIIGVDKVEVLNNFPQLNPQLEYLNDSIRFYGKLAHLKAIKILKSVDYSLFLRYNSKSVMAGFPTKFVESITCGVPVLTNKNSNVGDYLVEGVNGFWIDMSNKENLQKSLKKALYIKSEKMAEMKNLSYSSKTFDYRKFKGKFIELFKE